MIINIILGLLFVGLLIAMAMVSILAGLSNNLVETARLHAIFWVLMGLFAGVSSGLLIRFFSG